MPYYPDDVINEVFAENDIIDYVSRYVKLKKTGKDYSGLCPFHKEKSPSFHVSREKQLFHCFGCGASGNLVQFVMRSEGLDFVEAVKLLAERAGINLPENANEGFDSSYELKKKVYEMNKITARFYYDTLTKSPEGKTGYAYFAQRKITPKTITAYGLGFAPESGNALYRLLKKSGYGDDEIINAGLAVKRDDKIYDKFRNRVMFPIIDLRGNIIGFGGRIMGNAPEQGEYKIPKYLNSAETPVFNKGRNLFSLNFAKKSSPYSIILVEGYMDVITVYQAGITNVVATLGTALTENQAKLLMKYCNEILICYDSDGPGQKATIRAIEIINSVGGRSRVIKLKGAKDPDEYIKANGAAQFLKAVSDAAASTQFRLGLLRTKYSLDSPEGKALFVKEAVEVLQSVQDAVEVDAYINQIADETQVNRDAIYSEFRKKKASDARRIADEERIDRGKWKKNEELTVPVEIPPMIVGAEKKLIFLMVENKKVVGEVQKAFSSDDFSTDIHRKLVKMIYELKDENKKIEPSMLVNGFEGKEVNYVSDIFYNLEEYKDLNGTVSELIYNIKTEKIKSRMVNEKNPEIISELIKQLSELKSENRST
ncbi:MAG: DNA primase [Clostridia bacterium]|nr:DNA primase [Clostridia bacterium]